jgi:hypothetical protein
MRVESRRICNGHLCPANSPLHSTRDIPVAGETHPASFSVPDNQPLSDRERTHRPGGSEPGHWPPAAVLTEPVLTAPVLTGVSGSSLAPVGPVWISVPMPGQTPQS